jgi:hypothetical protein
MTEVTLSLADLTLVIPVIFMPQGTHGWDVAKDAPTRPFVKKIRFVPRRDSEVPFRSVLHSVLVDCMSSDTKISCLLYANTKALLFSFDLVDRAGVFFSSFLNLERAPKHYFAAGAKGCFGSVLDLTCGQLFDCLKDNGIGRDRFFVICGPLAKCTFKHQISENFTIEHWSHFVEGRVAPPPTDHGQFELPLKRKRVGGLPDDDADNTEPDSNVDDAGSNAVSKGKLQFSSSLSEFGKSLDTVQQAQVRNLIEQVSGEGLMIKNGAHVKLIGANYDLGVGTIPRQSQDSKLPFAKLQQAVGGLFNGASGFLGTCFLVSPAHIMTCFHVLFKYIDGVWIPKSSVVNVCFDTDIRAQVNVSESLFSSPDAKQFRVAHKNVQFDVIILNVIWPEGVQRDCFIPLFGSATSAYTQDQHCECPRFEVSKFYKPYEKNDRHRQQCWVLYYDANTSKVDFEQGDVIIGFKDYEVWYSTNTIIGNSGSPVLGCDGRFMALHRHAGKQMSDGSSLYNMGLRVDALLGEVFLMWKAMLKNALFGVRRKVFGALADACRDVASSSSIALFASIQQTSTSTTTPPFKGSFRYENYPQQKSLLTFNALNNIATKRTAVTRRHC